MLSVKPLKYLVMYMLVGLKIQVQGASKKMLHSDFSLKSVPGAGFYFFRGVYDSEFCA